MPVSSEHPQYRKHQERWERVRAVIDSDVKQFIRTIDPNDRQRERQYKEDAILTNFTLRTRNALLGSVFRKAAELDLPSQLEYLIDDATGDMLSLEQLSQALTGDTIAVGRVGVLVDYPTAEEGLTASEVSQMGLSARIKPYKTESIINWATESVGSTSVISMVVLRENITVLSDDGFEWVPVTQYRVLKLIEGVYTQIVMDDEDNIISVAEPRQADGATFNVIPFIFIGSENNDPDVDSAPLYDMANINIGHYKNSADYEELIHISGNPTLMISTNFSAEEFSEANPNGIKVGSRSGHNLGPGGSAQFLQVNPTQVADEAMQRKEQQAVMTGARLVMPQSGVETAEAARIRNSADNSVLSIIVNNVEDGVKRALEFCVMFMGGNPDDVVYELNKQFYDHKMDPQELMAQIQLLDRRVIATQDVRSSIRRAGIVDAERTDEDIDEDLLDMDPLI